MKKKALFTLALTGCTLGLMSTSCEELQKSEQSKQEEAPTVTVFPVMEEKVSDFGEWFGYLRGLDSTSIQPRVSGFLEKQHYENGARVKKGDVLFTIDSKIFMAQVKQAEANLLVARAKRASAEASVQQAELDVNRFSKLIKQNAISEKDLADARQLLRSAQAQVQLEEASIQQMEAALKRAQINLDYTTVRAPFDGVMGTAMVSQGSLISPATELATIVSIDPIRVDFSLSSSRILDALEYGESSSRKLPVTLMLENGSAYPLKGRLTAFDSKIDSNGLVNVTAEVENPDNVLRPGMAVRVRIPLVEKSVTLVPAQAIQSVLRTNYIIAVDKEGKPHMITVNLAGKYPIKVKEKSGYESQQEMLAVTGTLAPLAEQFQKLGYDKVTDTPIVCDPENALYANRVTGENSRLADRTQGKSIATAAFSFAPAAPKLAANDPAAKPLDPTNAKPSFPPFLVSVTPLIQRDVATQAEWFGSLRGVKETDIRAQVSGFLLKQDFTNGDIVKEGQLLFTIDPAPYEAAVEEAEANLDIAEAALKQAQVALEMNTENLERYSKLNRQSPGAVMEKTITDTETTVIRNKADILRAQATMEQMRALLHQAEINLGYTKIHAPFTGRAGIATPSVGDLISPDAATPLVTLSSVNPMRVDFNISGKLALKGYTEAKGQSVADAKIPFDIILENGTTYKPSGLVVSVDNKLSRTTGTLSVVGRVANDKGVLHSGMPVRISIDDEVMKGAYLVPSQSLLSFNGMDLIVFVLPNGAPMPLPVVKGKLVNLPTVDSRGETVLAPMQVVSLNRPAIIPNILKQEKVPSLEALIFREAQVSSWKELFLKKAEAPDIRSLMEKKSGKPMPEDVLVKQGVKSWDELFLKQNQAKDFRAFLFKEAEAIDEMDFMIKGAGAPDDMTLFLNKMGIKSLAESRVVVEGAFSAAMAFMGNEPYGGAPVNKLTLKPYVYTLPETVEPSITATKKEASIPPAAKPQPTSPSPDSQEK